MASKRVVGRRERAKETAAAVEEKEKERRKCVLVSGKGIFDLLDSFRYTGTGIRGGGGGPFNYNYKYPLSTVIGIGNKRKPTPSPSPSPPSTPSPLKPTAFAPPPLITAAVNKPKKPRKPKETAAAADTSSGTCAVNVKKVRKSRNLPKAAVAVNVKTVKKKKKKKTSSQLRAAEKRSEAYRRVPPDFNFMPPRSCHHLIQEDHTFDHWRVLVICMLLNMTTGKQVKKVVEDFFVLCPDAVTTTKVDTQQIQNVISTLGLHNKRSHMIKRLSEEYLRPDWTHVTSLHGIGKYAADAYAIFCTGKGADVRPKDHKLVDYWNSIYGNDTSFDAAA